MAMVSQEIASAVDRMLRSLIEVGPSQYRVDIEEVHGLYRSGFRNDILKVLIPIICRLRDRVRRGDAAYFASDQFIIGVSGAVRHLCKTMAMPADSIANTIKPILNAVHHIASDCIGGDAEVFIHLLDQLSAVLDLVETA